MPSKPPVVLVDALADHGAARRDGGIVAAGGSSAAADGRRLVIAANGDWLEVTGNDSARRASPLLTELAGAMDAGALWSASEPLLDLSIAANSEWPAFMQAAA